MPRKEKIYTSADRAANKISGKKAAAHRAADENQNVRTIRNKETDPPLTKGVSRKMAESRRKSKTPEYDYSKTNKEPFTTVKESRRQENLAQENSMEGRKKYAKGGLVKGKCMKK